MVPLYLLNQMICLTMDRVYNIQTHNIVGDSLFIIKTIDGNWKKIIHQKKGEW